jgi:hypothetical protein
MTEELVPSGYIVGETESCPWDALSVNEVQAEKLLAEFDIVRLQDGYRWTDEA